MDLKVYKDKIEKTLTGCKLKNTEINNKVLQEFTKEFSDGSFICMNLEWIPYLEKNSEINDDQNIDYKILCQRIIDSPIEIDTEDILLNTNTIVENYSKNFFFGKGLSFLTFYF